MKPKHFVTLAIVAARLRRRSPLPPTPPTTPGRPGRVDGRAHVPGAGRRMPATSPPSSCARAPRMLTIEKADSGLAAQGARRLSRAGRQGARADGQPRRGRSGRGQDARGRSLRPDRSRRPDRRRRQVALGAPARRQGRRDRRGGGRQEAQRCVRLRQGRHLRAQAGRRADLARQRRSRRVGRPQGLGQDGRVPDRQLQGQPRHRRDCRASSRSRSSATPTRSSPSPASRRARS